MIYRLEVEGDGSGGFRYASLVHNGEISSTKEFNDFGGVRQLPRWKSVAFRWESADVENRTPVGNFAYIFSGGINFAVDQKTKELLTSICENEIEFLPIEVLGDDDQWYMINIINVVEKALSLENSQFKIRPNGRFGRLTLPVFSDRNIPEESIFIYPQRMRDFMVKGEKLRKLIDGNDLTGVVLNEYKTV